MKKQTVLFVLIPNFADWEPAILSAGLNWGFNMWETTYEVKTVALTNDPVRSLGGFTVLPDYTVDDAPDDFAALILVGSTDWYSDEAKKIVPLIQKAFDKKLVIGAICDASRFLAVHGFVNDVDHTSNTLELIKETPNSLYTAENRYKNKQSVSDNNIITANGSAHIEFARDALIALNASTPEKIAELYTISKKGYFLE